MTGQFLKDMSVKYVFIVFVLIGSVFQSIESYSFCLAQNSNLKEHDSAPTQSFDMLAVRFQEEKSEEIPVAFIQSLLRSNSLFTIRKGITAARTHQYGYLFADDLKRVIVQSNHFETQHIAIHALSQVEMIPDIIWIESVLDYDKKTFPHTTVKIALIESIGLCKRSGHADSLLRKIYASDSMQMRLAAVTACPGGASLETASAILADALQSKAYVNFGVSANLIHGGPFCYQAAKSVTFIPKLDSRLISQLSYNLNEALAQCAEPDPDHEMLLHSHSLLTSLSKVPEKMPLVLASCRKLLSSPHASARHAVFITVSNVGPMFQTLEEEIVQAIDLDYSTDDEVEAIESGIRSLASIGATSLASVEKIRKAQSHLRLCVRLAACVAACYLKLPNSDSQQMLEKVISLEPVEGDEGALASAGISFAQIALATMPPEDAIRFLLTQSESLYQQKRDTRLTEYCSELEWAAERIEKYFGIVRPKSFP